MDLKILNVRNLIPVQIDYSLDGKEQFVYAYIDYETQTIIGADEVPKEILSDFNESVKSFITQPILDFDVPMEAYQNYEKGKKFDMNDYMTEDLNVQLKPKPKGEENARES
jgi:hypothetical protein